MSAEKCAKVKAFKHFFMAVDNFKFEKRQFD
jgi:hypothetical protein